VLIVAGESGGSVGGRGWLGQPLVDPKLSNTTPDQQNVKGFCPGWPVGSPTLHSSELANEHRAGSRGAALEEIFGFVQFI
jgi:hypothetical protein